MKGRTQIIDHPDALSRLSVLPGKRTPGAGSIVIADETLDPKVREDFATRLNRRYFACGCAEGAIGLTLGIAAAAVFLALGDVGWRSTGLIGLPLGGLVSGKLVGLVRAETRLKATVEAIRARWTTPKRPDADAWSCG